MDYELLFWVGTPIACALLILSCFALHAQAERHQHEWNKVHADDFNKDLWEE